MNRKKFIVGAIYAAEKEGKEHKRILLKYLGNRIFEEVRMAFPTEKYICDIREASYPKQQCAINCLISAVFSEDSFVSLI